jgi:predicted nucleic acid-binding protein
LLVGANGGDPEELRGATALVDSMLRLDMTPEVAGTAGRMQAKLLDDGRRLAIIDCLIAAATVVHGGTLVTRDDDFARFDDLDVLHY